MIGHDSAILCCAKLSNCTIVSGSIDRTFKIWNIKEDNEGIFQGTCELTLKHTSSVLCCNVLPDGRIVSGSYDGTIKIWSYNYNPKYLGKYGIHKKINMD